MIVGTKLSIAKGCPSFVFTDSTDFTGITITYYNIEIVKPGDTIPVTIDGISLKANDTTERTLTVTPDDLGYTDTLSDGIYAITIKINETGEGIQTKTLHSRVSCELKKCLMPKVANIPVNDDCVNCDNKKIEIDAVLTMYSQLEAVDAQIECGSLITAQELFDDIVKACATCNFC